VVVKKQWHKTVSYTDKTQPIHLAGSKNNYLISGCLILLMAIVCAFLTGFLYFIYPPRINVLIIGIDAAPENTYLGRSDTIIVTTAQPLKPYFGMLSIPRDLWVEIPGVGENRINTAHIFAELDNPGSGPHALLKTVQHNFGIDVEYYVRIRFDGFERIVEALDGVVVELENPMAGYPAGTHRLDSQGALAFVRDRSGTDDFYRMARGQLFLKAVIEQLANPDQWKNIPAVIQAIPETIDTNVPIWHWPRLILTIFRVGPMGIDSHVITREMVNPFTTDGGAQVLAPDWVKINPLVTEIFGR
jgi:LCP family protein required for cell wall assembly